MRALQLIDYLHQVGCSESEIQFLDLVSDEEFWSRYGTEYRVQEDEQPNALCEQQSDA